MSVSTNRGIRMSNYNKIVKSTHGKKSYKVLLKEAQAEVEYQTKAVEKYTKLQDEFYLNNAQESLESALAAVDFYKNKISLL